MSGARGAIEVAALDDFRAAFAASARMGRVSLALAVRIRGAIERSRASAWASRAVAAKADHTVAFGSQASLGTAWYTHFEEGRAREYFAGAAASDACVERHLPGFQRAFLALVGDALGVPLERRAGYAGPGIHVFAPAGPCARLGGEIHFDTEGLPVPYRDQRGPAFTAVLALSRVASGGGLRLWDLPYDGHEDPLLGDLVAPVTIPYEPGDLVLFESYRLHQIEPFEGDEARVSATCHVARLGGRWVGWF